MIFSKTISTYFILSLFSSLASAQVTETVLERGNRFKPILVQEELPNLVSDQEFDGKYFKIVKGKSDVAIPISETDEALKLRAATAYYHLNKARDFWVNVMHSDYVRDMPKITIRLEITNKFSELGHFQHDSIEPQYNNALSIPLGETMDGATDRDGNPVKKEYWGREIWFRPVKKIRTADLPASGLGPGGNPFTEYAKMLAEPIDITTENRFIQVTIQKIFYPLTLTQSYESSVIGQAGTFLLTSLILEASKHSDKFFLEKYYYLDTAMIPEIIYHEYSHIALSDHLALSLSTPVLEGMADYFSTAISGDPHIANKIKKYSLSMPKNGKNKTTYHSVFETNLFANSDFVLSVLWSVKQKFPTIADELVYDARTRLSTESSDIRHDLINSLLESCSKLCADPRADRLKLRQVFEDKGF